MEKHLIDRRMTQLADEGSSSSLELTSAKSITGANLRRDFSAVVLAIGAEHPRNLNVPDATEGHSLRDGILAAAE